MKTLRYLPIVLVIFLWGCFPEPGVVQPELCFDVEVVQCSPGESEHVEVSTCVNEGDTYIWDWGDGVTEKGPSLSHVYASSGTYTITLTVTNQRGGRVTQSQRVAINKIKFEKIGPFFTSNVSFF